MKRLLLAAIRFYQRHISAHTNPVCRFTPTCSQYAAQAIGRYGALRGGLMATWRVLRCNPFGGHGYDPVPPRFTLRRVSVPVYMDEEEALALYDEEDGELPEGENPTEEQKTGL